jgi:hypothetical protein
MTTGIDGLSVAVPAGEDGAAPANDESTSSGTKTATYRASIYPGSEDTLPTPLGAALSKLEAGLGMPVWLLLQDDHAGPFAHLDEEVVKAFRSEKRHLPDGQLAFVINSPGGQASSAYELATFLRRKCGGFTAVVPDAAMSAATLFTLGADSILMGEDAVLGPLDAQVWDVEAETYNSALNEVQALERLRAYALESIDETMWLLVQRTHKRVDSLLPHVLRFIADMTRPLMEKIDVVHYNERARILKVAEEYAIRLLRPNYPDSAARMIAASLVEKYPEHGFRIDREEAKRIGLHVGDPTGEQAGVLEDLWGKLQGVNAVGRLEEVVTSGNGDD